MELSLILSLLAATALSAAYTPSIMGALALADVIAPAHVAAYAVPNLSLADRSLNRVTQKSSGNGTSSEASNSTATENRCKGNVGHRNGTLAKATNGTTTDNAPGGSAANNTSVDISKNAAGNSTAKHHHHHQNDTVAADRNATADDTAGANCQHQKHDGTATDARKGAAGNTAGGKVEPPETISSKFKVHNVLVTAESDAPVAVAKLMLVD